MLELGETLGKALSDTGVNNATIFLKGDLGAGKTIFTRGLLQKLGFCGPVKSPTYTIVEPYEIKDLLFYHFDFYRIKDIEELELMGIRDYFFEQAIRVIEWPEYATGLKLSPDFELTFDILGSARTVTISPMSNTANEVIKKINA